MDEVLRTSLESRLRAAIESGNQQAYRIALLDVQIAQMQCQEKTAQRVKALETYIRDAEQRAAGATLATKALLALASAGGGAALLKLLQAII